MSEKSLIVIMRASKEHGTMKEYLAQLDKAGIEHFVDPITDFTKENDLGASVEFQRRLSKKFSDYGKIVFTDAWDVTFYGTKEQVLAKIPDQGVILGAERNCFPDPSLEARMPGHTAWKFCNGGLIAGKPSEILAFDDDLEASPSFSRNFLNQGFYNILKYNGKLNKRVKVDERTELFYCLFKEQVELQFERGIPVNSLLGTHPNFIHANGNWSTKDVFERRDKSLIEPEKSKDSKMLGNVGLHIGLPFCGRPVAPAWAICLACQNYPLNTNRVIHATDGKEIGEARNEIVEKALAGGARYLWFLDDDVSVPAHAAKALIGTLQNADSKTMVAGGIYCAKAWPTEPVVYRGDGTGAFWKWKVGDIFEVTSIGTGCMMIDMEVFKHLERPWFQTIDEMETVDRPCIQITDDIVFCQAVRKAGFKILADSNVLTSHWSYDAKENKFTPYYLNEDCYPLRPVSEEEPRCQRKLEL